MADSLITLFQPKTTAEEEEALLRENMARTAARMSPQEYSTYLAAKGGNQLGRGIVQTGAAAFGYDARSPGEREDDAIAAAKAEVQALGFDPEKPESIDQFYRQVIGILQRRGLVAQAMQVAKEYQTQKAANTRASAEVDKAAAARLRAERLGPLEMKLNRLAELDKQLAGMTEDEPEYAAIKRNRDYLQLAIEKEVTAKKDIRVLPSGDKNIIYDVATNKQIGEFPIGAKPKAPGSGSGTTKTTQTDRDREDYIALAKKRDSGEGMTEDEERKLAILEKKLKMEEKTKEEGRVPAQLAADLGGVVGQLRVLVDMSKRFRKDFSGGVIAKGASIFGLENQLSIAKRMAATNPAASAWWQEYYNLIAAIRNALFGASLTGSEGVAFDQIKTSPGDDPNMVLQIMRQQAEFANNTAVSKAEGLSVSGYNASGLIAALNGVRPYIATIPARVAAAPSPSTVAPAPAAAPKVPGQSVTVQTAPPPGAPKQGWKIERVN